MAISGMGHMLKALGVDPEEITKSVTTFMETVQAAIAEVRANQQAITQQNESTQFLLREVVAQNQEILTILKRNALEDGEDARPSGPSIFDVRPMDTRVDKYSTTNEVSEWPMKPTS